LNQLARTFIFRDGILVASLELSCVPWIGIEQGQRTDILTLSCNIEDSFDAIDPTHMPCGCLSVRKMAGKRDLTGDWSQ